MTLDVKSTVELGTSTFRENFAANIVYFFISFTFMQI